MRDPKWQNQVRWERGIPEGRQQLDKSDNVHPCALFCLFLSFPLFLFFRLLRLLEMSRNLQKTFLTPAETTFVTHVGSLSVGNSPRLKSIQKQTQILLPIWIDKQSSQPYPSDGPWGSSVGRINNVVKVVAHGDEQVEKELAAASLHLSLHCSAPLESLPAADDECEVMGAQARV